MHFPCVTRSHFFCPRPSDPDAQTPLVTNLQPTSPAPRPNVPSIICRPSFASTPPPPPTRTKRRTPSRRYVAFMPLLLPLLPSPPLNPPPFPSRLTPTLSPPALSRLALLSLCLLPLSPSFFDLSYRPGTSQLAACQFPYLFTSDPEIRELTSLLIFDRSH
ncbi:hypothetical protein CC85DRAFT_160541 [Cutaneotrichosporon oleaginosum]|uniref:Uncharacterized protein n=1 Tax=Cutaneotrichosporon oleaginosum TaxID=879819 RepID=A0A0J0XGG5_9TREE|nr:uncharacterized protein CC85DRAFT_160541 [Cutaneotrichosporon oleaginosum]KLT40195.1 hypothetical protein CC85DRAFT_160541 [Cutaneotrichosporon oleaginosum]TXT10514.1 hypothetical protein COLE_04448 [Cutaneotrichosporon oleaginosum]